MILKYVGPKAHISQSGITFDNNKEDKYVYLHIALQIIKALDHEYIEDRVYTYNADTKRLGDDDLYREARTYCHEIDRVIAEAEHHTAAYVDDLLERARENTLLDETERETLYKNITIMRSYIIQRAVNKAVYYCVIHTLVELLKKDNIDYVIAPMFQKFAHVFHTVQGVLINQKVPVNSNMEIYEENGRLLVKLDVVNQ